MKKLLNLGLLISSLFGYLKWGDNSSFLFEVEYQLLFRSAGETQAFVHPFVLLPLLGQLLLLISLFRKQPSRWLTYLGIGCLSLIMLMLFLIGVLGFNIRILISSLPFIVLAIITIVLNRKKTKTGTNRAVQQPTQQ